MNVQSAAAAANDNMEYAGVPALSQRAAPRLVSSRTAEQVESARHEATVAELYRLHGPAVYRRCRRLLKNSELAQDATQEVFCRLVRNLHKLQDHDLVAWVYRVATNHCLNMLRDTRGHGEEELDLDLHAPSVGHGCSLDSLLVRSLLSRFDEATQTIAVCVLVEGMDHQEAAEMMGVSRRTAERKLDRFLLKSRQHLVRSGAAAAAEA